MSDVDPHPWFTQTLERIAQGWPASNIDRLMPWNLKAGLSWRLLGNNAVVATRTRGSKAGA
jgi:hypothetical protein